jgi:hypothetical protein
MMCGVGALVTLDLPADSPALTLPWIITIGPLSDDDEWEPVVCGPYERAHALALAEELVADDELMAVVEPVVPHVTVEAIREDIATARALAAEEADDEADDDADTDVDDDEEEDEDDEYDEAEEDEYEEEEDDEEEDGEEDDGHAHAGPPTPEEIREGFTRIAARLVSGG